MVYILGTDSEILSTPVYGHHDVRKRRPYQFSTKILSCFRTSDLADALLNAVGASFNNQFNFYFALLICLWGKQSLYR